MKKQLIAGLCGFFALTLATTNINAQDLAMARTVIDSKLQLEYSMADINSTAGASKLTAAEVSPKALKSFNKSFKNTTPTWYAVNKNYLATFNMNGRNTRALLAKNGYVIYSISYGQESSLPKDVRRTLKSNYIDHRIGSVSEVKAGEHQAWVVNLQDDNELVVARVLEGSLDELQHFTTKPPQPKKTRRGRIIIPK